MTILVLYPCLYLIRLTQWPNFVQLYQWWFSRRLVAVFVERSLFVGATTLAHEVDMTILRCWKFTNFNRLILKLLCRLAILILPSIIFMMLRINIHCLTVRVLLIRIASYSYLLLVPLLYIIINKDHWFTLALSWSSVLISSWVFVMPIGRSVGSSRFFGWFTNFNTLLSFVFHVFVWT